MTSYRDSVMTQGQVEQLLREALHERVSQAEPARRVRMDILNAAAADRALPIVEPLHASMADLSFADEADRRRGQQQRLHARMMVDMLLVQTLGVHFAA